MKKTAKNATFLQKIKQKTFEKSKNPCKTPLCVLY